MTQATEKAGPAQSNNGCGYDPFDLTVAQQEFLHGHHLQMNYITTLCTQLNANVPSPQLVAQSG